LLRLLSPAKGSVLANRLKTRPALGLGFPGTDLQKIEARADGGYEITANFLGLYGVTSPLPTHYTEELLVQLADGFSVNREFLDIFAQSIYPIFFRAWLKPRASLRIVEYDDTAMLDILYAFVGIPASSRKVDVGHGLLLRCGALFSQQTRSAAGLQAVVEACFPDVDVEVKQLQQVWVKIAEDQTFQLGRQACVLGQDSHVGQFCRSFSGITISLSEVDKAVFRQFLPGGKRYEQLHFLVDYYLTEPLPVRVELSLLKGAAEPTQLSGSRWARLGRDTWLLHDEYEQSAFTFFDLPIRQGQKKH
jgi:type VI secretion system protein ImpH